MKCSAAASPTGLPQTCGDRLDIVQLAEHRDRPSLIEPAA